MWTASGAPRSVSPLCAESCPNAIGMVVADFMMGAGVVSLA